MNNEKRSCIAFICAIHIDSTRADYLYDCIHKEYKKYHRLSTEYPNMVNIYDYQRQAYIMGTFPNFYDYQSGKYVYIDMMNNSFKGYDYESGAYFQGEVSNDMVRIYDYGESEYFYYRIY